jgi:exopolysaccharide biosynthesis polyprenyl glycosylphosphotransferase
LEVSEVRNDQRKTLKHLVQLFDLFAVLLCFGLATITVSRIFSARVSFSEFLELRIKIQNIIIFSGIILLWHQVFRMFDMYESRRLSRKRDEVVDIVKATTLGTILMYGIALAFHVTMINYVFATVFWASLTCITVAGRLTVRFVLRQVRIKGKNLRNIVVVGSNDAAVQFARKIEDSPWLGYRILAFVDEDWPGISKFNQEGYSLACNFEGLRSFMRRNVVDEVVVTLPLRSLHSHATEIAELCEEQGILLRMVSNLFDLKRARSKVEEFEGDSHITHSTGTIVAGWQAFIKWAVDFTASLLLVIFFTPLFLLVAVLIKLTSPGPVFFLQERLGLNKRRFKIYKFRTMSVDAESRMKEIEHLNEVSGPVFKIKNDPRITPIGKFLRSTSIDELPQLLNVLKGDMSLVGPRPMAVRDYEGFNEDWQRRRFSVRPGITCLWQVLGRNTIPFEQWMELDLQYIDRWSLWLDFTILMKTIPAVLKGSGAS